jgi:hypothetical protein
LLFLISLSLRTVLFDVTSPDAAVQLSAQQAFAVQIFGSGGFNVTLFDGTATLFMSTQNTSPFCYPDGEAGTQCTGDFRSTINAALYNKSIRFRVIDYDGNAAN